MLFSWIAVGALSFMSQILLKSYCTIETSNISKLCHSFFFFLQRLLNMHIYDNTMYANLEDLNA